MICFFNKKTIEEKLLNLFCCIKMILMGVQSLQCWWVKVLLKCLCYVVAFIELVYDGYSWPIFIAYSILKPFLKYEWCLRNSIVL